MNSLQNFPFFVALPYGIPSLGSRYPRHNRLIADHMTTNGDSSEKDRLPSSEIGYAYAIGMLFAQQLEVNLRALLYVTDYHAWGDEMTLDKSEKRFKTLDRFIDKATCGALIKKLKSSKTVFDDDAWSSLERACEHRNRLAHSFLAEHDFVHFTSKDENQLLGEIHAMIKDLRRGLLVTRSLRRQTERLADEEDRQWAETMNVLGISNWEDPNRHYATRKKKKL